MSNENNDLIEKIADFMHDQWSHWMNYLFAQSKTQMTIGISKVLNLTSLEFKTEDIQRWKEQILTPYSELSEKEKDSDREWAIKLLELLSKTHELRNRNNCTNCDRYAEEDHLCQTRL